MRPMRITHKHCITKSSGSLRLSTLWTLNKARNVRTHLNPRVGLHGGGQSNRHFAGHDGLNGGHIYKPYFLRSKANYKTWHPKK